MYQINKNQIIVDDEVFEKMPAEIKEHFDIIHTNPECPCYMLDEQSGERLSGGSKKPRQPSEGRWFGKNGFNAENIIYNDTGGASRFFYTVKGDNTNFSFRGKKETHNTGYASKDGTEQAIIHTNPECPCYMLDEQSGMLTTNSTGKNSPSDYQTKSVFGAGYKSGAKPYKSDTGGASRFFYCAKASRSERLFGLEGYILKQDTPEDIQKEIGNKFMIISKEQYNKLPEKYQKYFKEFRNEHCTVKPLKLMQYLCTLTKTPTGGIVLDPFAGSGTTLMAAKKTGRDFIGIEKEEEYCKIAEARIKATTVQYRLF